MIFDSLQLSSRWMWNPLLAARPTGPLFSHASETGNGWPDPERSSCTSSHCDERGHSQSPNAPHGECLLLSNEASHSIQITKSPLVPAKLITNKSQTESRRPEVKYVQTSAPALSKVPHSWSSLLSLRPHAFRLLHVRATHPHRAPRVSAAAIFAMHVAASGYSLRFLSFCGFTASFPRAPCNSACGRAGGLLPAERAVVTRLGML